MARKKKNEKDAPVAVIDEAATIEEKEEPEFYPTVIFDGKAYVVSFIAGNTLKLYNGEIEICVAKSAVEPVNQLAKDVLKD